MIEIQENIPLAPLTTFRIGGNAKKYVEVNDIDQLKEALDFANKNGFKIFILGGGSNLLVSDKGFDGLVVKIKYNELKVDEENGRIIVAAGVPLVKLVNESINNSLSGMEWAAGIPGTVGGAVRGNARAFGKNIAGVVESVQVVNAKDLTARDYSNEDCQFTYWGSVFKNNSDLIVVSASVKLQSGEKEKSRSEANEIIAKRISVQPQGFANAGSFFLNPVVSDKDLIERFEKDKEVKIKDDKIPAGWLIQEAGLIGKKMGGAMISEKHANFIINTGTATAEDVIMLESFIKQQIRDKFGIQLESEVNHVGF